MTLFEALMGGAFDLLNWQHSGEFDQNSSKKSNAWGFAQGGGGGGGMDGFGIDRYITWIECLQEVHVRRGRMGLVSFYKVKGSGYSVECTPK